MTINSDIIMLFNLVNPHLKENMDPRRKSIQIN